MPFCTHHLRMMTWRSIEESRSNRKALVKSWSVLILQLYWLCLSHIIDKFLFRVIHRPLVLSRVLRRCLWTGNHFLICSMRTYLHSTSIIHGQLWLINKLHVPVPCKGIIRDDRLIKDWCSIRLSGTASTESQVSGICRNVCLGHAHMFIGASKYGWMWLNISSFDTSLTNFFIIFVFCPRPNTWASRVLLSNVISFASALYRSSELC